MMGGGRGSFFETSWGFDGDEVIGIGAIGLLGDENFFILP